MDEIIKEIKEKSFLDKTNKIAYAIGYMQDSEKVNKKEALEVIYKILVNEI